MRALLVLVVAALCACAASAQVQTRDQIQDRIQPQDKVALVIGNAKYGHEDRLFSPLEDAAAMRRALEALGFQVTQTLLNGDRLGMRKAITNFRRRAAEADTALVYYSGHGLEIRGRNYLIPVDVRLDDEEEARSAAVDLGDLARAAAGASRLSVVVIDACRNDAFSSDVEARRNKALRPLPRQVLAFASAPGQPAFEGDRLSPYTQALTELLARPGVEELDVRAIFGGLGERVTELSGDAQKPFMRSAGLGAGLVTLAGGAAGR